MLGPGRFDMEVDQAPETRVAFVHHGRGSFDRHLPRQQKSIGFESFGEVFA